MPTGTVLFITIACSVGVAELLDHRLDAREVGVARVGGRRVDAAEQEPRVLEHLAHVGREVSRSRFLLTSSGRPGSWIGTSPRAERVHLLRRMSRATTWWPSSAKQAAVTRPTQPTPITPIGSLSAISERGSLESRSADRAAHRARGTPCGGTRRARAS